MRLTSACLRKGKDSFLWATMEIRTSIFLRPPTLLTRQTCFRFTATIGEAFSTLSPEMPNQERPRHTRAKIERLAKIKPGSAWEGWHFRDTMDRPSRTVTGHCRDDWVHPTENRGGTVREMATLQSFPNDYVFKGPIMAMNFVKFNFQYRQVGNAVPVLLAKPVGQSILKRVRDGRAAASGIGEGEQYTASSNGRQ